MISASSRPLAGTSKGFSAAPLERTTDTSKLKI
jgi:hypothetical protein